MDAPPSASPPQDPAAYVYAATDYRPRQAREIELCAQASHFDWLYTGTFAAGVVGSVLLSSKVLRESEEPGIRLVGPGMIGFTWGGFLSGGFLSLPRCDPNWSYGPPPEGGVRASWPMAVIVTMLSAATAPVIDFTFLGGLKDEWQDWERSTRVFIGIGAGAIGAIFPYLLPPRPWAAKLEIEKIRIGAVNGGPFVSYGLSF